MIFIAEGVETIQAIVSYSLTSFLYGSYVAVLLSCRMVRP